MEFTKEKQFELKLISIPQTNDFEVFERNRERADRLNLEHCPCCGKPITNPKYFFNSAFGGCAYLACDKTEYSDCWVMGVGSECRKKFPKGYVFKQ